jgi:predicted phage tail protein
MMVVALYGVLGQKFGRTHRYAVRTPAQAVKALCATIPGFKRFLLENSKPGYRVVTRFGDTAPEQLIEPIPDGVIRIVPVVTGSKGVGQVIVGAIMIYLAWWNPMGWSAAAGTMSGLALKAMSSLGWALVFSGIGQMLAPSPKTEGSVEKADNQPSYSFDGPVNTMAQGNPVAVAYGELIVGSQVLSAGLDVTQIDLAPATTGGNTSQGPGDAEGTEEGEERPRDPDNDLSD